MNKYSLIIALCTFEAYTSFTMNPYATGLVAWEHAVQPSGSVSENQSKKKPWYELDIFYVSPEVDKVQESHANDCEKLAKICNSLELLQGMQVVTIDYPIKNREKNSLTTVVKRKAFTHYE